MKPRPIAILAVVVFAICIGAIWFLQKESGPAVAPVEVIPVAKTDPGFTTIPVNPPPSLVKSATPKAVAAPVAKPAVPVAEWELKIDQLLRSNIAETETAQILINMLPTLPAEGQSEAAQHISNLILDKDYNRVLPLVKNTSLPEEVLDVFVTDLMNRDDAVKLPTLLEIAKLPNHPHHEEALTDLQIFLDGDFGNDWGKWTSSMQAYLKKQASDNAPESGSQPAPITQ
ncbi:MAG: hypothetical protein JWL90_3333 [Chthoniobacteraceae bacterium]|nr:hypothetical protein [Chthoniobacteraceae bacterium]